MTQITLRDIHPFVRFVHKFLITRENIIKNKRGYDHRLFYVLAGNGYFLTNGRKIKAEHGNCLLIPSGTEYSIICEGEQSIEAIGVNFDYTKSFSHITSPVFPIYIYRQEKQLERLEFTDYPELNSSLVLPKINIIEERILALLSEYEKALLFMEQKLCGIFTDLLTDILRTHILQKNGVRQTVQKSEEILGYIRSHYAEIITGEILSKKFGYHKNHINYLVKLKTGTSLHRYLINYRLSKAVDLLRTTTLPVSEIASLVGFQDYVYFLKCFKRHMGTTTKKFRSRE